MFRLINPIIAVLMLYGCAALEASRAQDTEQLLSAAGFHLQLADTPEKMAHVSELTQHKLVPHEKDGAIIYVYADATSCRCVYAGDEAAYQRYQLLAIQTNIADEQRQAAQANENAAMNWGMWGWNSSGAMWGSGW